MSEEKLQPTQLIDPKSGDTVRAEDMLQEISAVLRKYGYGLLFNPAKKCMVLAQIGGLFNAQARVIAEVYRILPEGVVWKQIDWTPAKKLPGKAENLH